MCVYADIIPPSYWLCRTHGNSSITTAHSNNAGNNNRLSKWTQAETRVRKNWEKKPLKVNGTCNCIEWQNSRKETPNREGNFVCVCERQRVWVNVMWVLIKMTNQQIYVRRSFPCPFDTDAHTLTYADVISWIYLCKIDRQKIIYIIFELGACRRNSSGKISENAGDKSRVRAEGAFMIFRG